MRLRILALTLLALGPGMRAQELVIDPETGDPKLIFEDREEPLEEIFPPNVHPGGENLAVPFEGVDPNWTLPRLVTEEALSVQGAALDIHHGKASSALALEVFGVKSVPALWNLLKGSKAAGEVAAPLAATMPGHHGESFIYTMALSPHAEIRRHALANLSKLEGSALLGLWHEGSDDLRRLVEAKFDAKKAKGLDQSTSMLRSPKGPGHFLAPKTGSLTANLYIDLLAASDVFPFLTATEKRKPALALKAAHELLETASKSPADNDHKLLARVVLGDAVKFRDLDKLSRHRDWHLRLRLCQALARRRDLRWEMTPHLLERQRDVCLLVREAANRALVTLHRLPHEWPAKRALRPDSHVVMAWELWWRQKERMTALLKALDKEPAQEGHFTRNARVMFSESSRNFDTLTLKVPGLKVPLVIIDANRNGRFDDFGSDRMVLGDPEKELSCPLSRQFPKGKDQLLVDVDEAGGVRLKELKHVRVPVTFKFDYAGNHTPSGVSVSSAPDMHFLIATDGSPTLLPPGTYKFSDGFVLGGKSEIGRLQPNPRATAFLVPEGGPGPVVTFGQKLRLEAICEYDRSHNRVNLSRLLVVGASGEIYKKINPLVQSVEVEIRAGDAKPLTRTWTATYRDVTTQMVGGLTPPLTEEQVYLYQAADRDLAAAQTQWSAKTDEKTAAEAALEAARADLAGVPALLTSKRAEKETKVAQLATKQTAKTSKQTELNQKQSELGTQQNIITDRQQTLAVRQAELAQKQADLVTAQAQVPQDPALIADLQSEIAALQAEITDLNTQIAAAQGQVAILQGQIAALQAEITVLNTEITALEAEIATLTAQITDLESDRFQTAVANLEAQVATLTAALAALDATIATLTQTLNAGAGLAGLDIASFRTALLREEGMKLLARAMSDNSWQTLHIEEKDIPGIAEADEVTVTFKAKPLSFGAFEDRVFKVPLK